MLQLFCLALFLSCANTFELYCPGANDLAVAYTAGTTPTLSNQGWTLHGGGGVSTKSAFNLLGGYAEYDIDVSQVTASTNANIYTISPTFSGGSSSSFNKGADYCDGQGGAGSPQFCNEVDWIESNGACGGATAIHTKPGGGVGGCDAWGCNTGYAYGGKTQFHMKAEYGTDGSLSLYRDGVLVTGYNPGPTAADWAPLQTQYSQRGAVIYSTQWQGWVPTVPGGCPSGGDLSSSVLTISNLVIYGAVVQGPIPTKCANSPSDPSSPPPPPPPPSPVPVPQAQSGGSGSCFISKATSDNFYFEVTSAAGASVSIQCSSGYVQQCTVSSWGDATVFQCGISNNQPCSNAVPSCGSGSGGGGGVGGSGSCSASLFPNNGNNEWWMVVQVSPHPASVSISCSNSAAHSACAPSGWQDDVYACPISGAPCDNPVFSCTSQSGSRVTDDQQPSSSKAALAPWAIALIALCCAIVVLGVVLVVLFVQRKSEERV